MKLINFQKIFTVGILLALVFSLSACTMMGKKTSVGSSSDAAASNPALEKEYEDQLSAILHPIWSADENIDWEKIKASVLALRTPAKYLDLHLNLVLSLDSLEQGIISASQEKIESALDKIKALKEQYPWLK